MAVHVESGDVKVVVAPPGSRGIDRRLYRLINGLPHTTTSDRYVSVLSDLGEGLGWVALGIGLAVLGGPKGRRAGGATALASLGATYVVQTRVKPIFRRVRPFVNREARVVGIRPADRRIAGKVHAEVHPRDADSGRKAIRERGGPGIEKGQGCCGRER